MEYKYKIEIDKAIEVGAIMPVLYPPQDKGAYRFVFMSEPNRNHIPVCVSNPKRVLPKDIMTSGYALSCFGNEEKALVRYNILKCSFKLINKTIGDGIAYGIITDNDGVITEESVDTSHFDFYEYSECKPEQIFTLKHEIICTN